MVKTESQRRGLLVMHYGTPASLEDVEAYYTHIRRGRAPSSEQLQDLVERYRAIGGPSPLTEISHRQAEAIRAGLAKKGIDVPLFVGTKHAPPFIGDAVEAMAAQGIREVVAIVLAPHYSSFSVAAYRKAALEARDRVAPEMTLSFVERWGAMPAFIDALATRVGSSLEGWAPGQTLVVFTAHSLPERIMAEGDPYREELLETSRLVAERLGLPNWTFAFQSASDTGEPWLGPDILEVLEARAGDYDHVVACTVGFVSDHLEVLFDLGIEARAKAQELGLEFRRADTINDEPGVMEALADLAADRFTAAGSAVASPSADMR
jgi:protoporphyrin/coproporphyrin ferrochelatase